MMGQLEIVAMATFCNNNYNTLKIKAQHQAIKMSSRVGVAPPEVEVEHMTQNEAI